LGGGELVLATERVLAPNSRRPPTIKPAKVTDSLFIGNSSFFSLILGGVSKECKSEEIAHSFSQTPAARVLIECLQCNCKTVFS